MRKLFQLLGLTNEQQTQSSRNKGTEFGMSGREGIKQSYGEDELNQGDPNQKTEFQNIDEEFAYNFTREGGKFMFCLSKKSLHSTLTQVLKEQDWNKVFINEAEVNVLLEGGENLNELKTDVHLGADVFISTCDNLVAFNGRIMVSSNQCKNLNFSELPINHIIIANHSQIVKNLGEGLRRINSKYFRNLPSKITTLKNKNTARNSGTSKNIYVFLLEDY